MAILSKADASHRPAAARAVVGWWLACLLAASAPGCWTAAQAATSAGTVVSNTGTMRFDMGGAGRTVSSNTVEIILAERLDVIVTADAPTASVAGNEEQAVAFHVSNGGNGTETFDLAGAAKGDGASVIAFAADTDGDGVYDPQIDRRLTDAQLSLAPGAAASVFVIIGGGRPDTEVSLTATAATGNGPSGTAFVGKGDGGGDAVVGTSASSTAIVRLVAGQTEPTLTKSQAVLAPDGSARPIKGAVITYTLAARFPSATAAVEIADPIPAGTVYLPGSLTLDGALLSDTADGDFGRFDGRAVTIGLGDIPAAATRTIRFQVTIQ